MKNLMKHKQTVHKCLTLNLWQCSTGNQHDKLSYLCMSVCLSVAALIHQKIDRSAWKFCSTIKIITEGAMPNIY